MFKFFRNGDLHIVYELFLKHPQDFWLRLNPKPIGLQFKMLIMDHGGSRQKKLLKTEQTCQWLRNIHIIYHVYR